MFVPDNSICYKFCTCKNFVNYKIPSTSVQVNNTQDCLV